MHDLWHDHIHKESGQLRPRRRPPAHGHEISQRVACGPTFIEESSVAARATRGGEAEVTNIVISASHMI